MRQAHMLAAWLAAPALAAAQGAAAPAVPTEFPPEAQALGDAALRERFSGRVLRAQPATGPGWRLEYKDTGYVFMDLTNGGRDTGRWRVEGTRLCIDFQRFPSGCNEIRALGEVLYLKRGSGEVVALNPS